MDVRVDTLAADSKRITGYAEVTELLPAFRQLGSRFTLRRFAGSIPDGSVSPRYRRCRGRGILLYRLRHGDGPAIGLSWSASARSVARPIHSSRTCTLST
jgi:hypothetical protein